MPKFLEHDLENAAHKRGLTGEAAEHYAYGAMNNMGAMHGSKETAKGREMEKKHQEDQKAMKHEPMREMRVEMHRGQGGKLTGFTVHHHMVPKQSKSPAFMEDTHVSHPFSADDHAGMMAHVSKHLKGQISGAGPAQSGDNAAMDEADTAEEEAAGEEAE